MFDYDKIAKGGKSYIIAEAGVNHNGNIKFAYELVDAAAEAGADAIKFQTFSADKLVTKNTEKADYQKKTTEAAESQYAMLKKLELGATEHKLLYNYCRDKGIDFLSTPFDLDSVKFLDDLGVEAFKISSGDITNMPMIKMIARIKKPIILSTGMSDLADIKDAVSWINEEEKFPEIILLHCTTAYPTAFEEVNLYAMQYIKDNTGLPVGYSDHTVGIEIPIAAVALGACVIEKHFTLSRNLEGPDHKASLEPNELKSMVTSIRNVESAVGNKIKEITKTELKNKDKIRKSIVANKDMKKGDILTEDNIILKRPGNGIHPREYYSILGKKVSQDIKKDTLLDWKYIIK